MKEVKKTSNMTARAAIVIALALVVGLVIYAKNSSNGRVAEPGAEAASSLPAQAAAPSAGANAPQAANPARAAIPTLLNLGADQCIPCKMMAPIREELKREYAGRMEIAFIDVWKDRGAGARYALRVIPTQIFFGPDGKELFRHEGFFAKEDILAKWAELGYTF